MSVVGPRCQWWVHGVSGVSTVSVVGPQYQRCAARENDIKHHCVDMVSLCLVYNGRHYCGSFSVTLTDRCHKMARKQKDLRTE